MKRLTKFANLICPKCQGRHLTPLPQFEGRPRLYCEECEEEILMPWSAQVGYPQDVSLPSPSIQEGNN
jgi:hypothetical protein